MEIFAHNYRMGAESPADLDFVFVAFQEADSSDVRMQTLCRRHTGWQRCLCCSQLLLFSLFNTELDLSNCTSVQGQWCVV